MSISLSRFFADRYFEDQTEPDGAEVFNPAADELKKYVSDKANGVKLSKREAEFLISLLNNYIDETFG